MVFLTVNIHKNGALGWEIGHDTFLDSFFNTVAHHLKNRKWGEKFPTIMKEFYKGELAYEKIEIARKELAAIRKAFAKLPKTAIVWDFDDLEVKPPWGDYIADRITDMSNYFGTSDGAEDLFEVIEKAFASGEKYKLPVRIENI